jgi:hypothetical protein
VEWKVIENMEMESYGNMEMESYGNMEMGWKYWEYENGMDTY